ACLLKESAMIIRRRNLLQAGSAAAFVLPRVAIGQADQRPAISVAVQQIANANTLEPLREQSNVCQRIVHCYLECLIEQNLQGNLEQVPALATEWKRIDDRTIDFSLRRGVKFHNG